MFFLLGYGLALPIGAKFATIKASQNRIAMIGHQVGVFLAAVGWGARGSVAMVAVHMLWIVAARIWFGMGSDSD